MQLIFVVSNQHLPPEALEEQVEIHRGDATVEEGEQSSDSISY